MAEIALPTKKHVWKVGDRIKFNTRANANIWDHYATIVDIGTQFMTYRYEKPLHGYPSQKTVDLHHNSAYFDYCPFLPDSTDPYSVLKWLESE